MRSRDDRCDKRPSWLTENVSLPDFHSSCSLTLAFDHLASKIFRCRLQNMSSHNIRTFYGVQCMVDARLYEGRLIGQTTLKM